MDLPVAVDDQFAATGWYPAGGQFSSHLLPEEFGQFKSDQAIQNAAGLLGIDKVEVHCSWLLDGLLDGWFGDLMEDNPFYGVVWASQVEDLTQIAS